MENKMKTFLKFYEGMIATSNLFKLKQNIGKEINAARDKINNSLSQSAEYNAVQEDMLRLKKNLDNYYQGIINEISGNKELLQAYLTIKNNVDAALEIFRDPPSDTPQTQLLQNTANALDQFYTFIQSQLSV